MAVTTSQITITTMEGWYSGDTAPSNPLIGDLWLDTTSNEIKKWDGTNWVKQADAQGPQGPKGDSIKSREAYWIKSSTKPEPPDSETGDMKGWTKGSEPPESALAGILPSDKFWRIYKETYSNGESEYIKYSEAELIGSYEVLNGLVQFRKGVTTTENIDGQDVTVIDGGKIKTGSIDAKKIHVEDLEALKATIGGFHIGKNSIYSGNKKTIDSIERGIYFDSNGQSYFGDNKNFIRFFRSDKDNYKLQISADSLTFGSGVSVEKAFEDIKGDIQNAQGTANKAQSTANTANNKIDNLEIGGRNLITNSKNLKNFKNESSSYISMIFTDADVTVTGTKSIFGIYYNISVEGVSYYTLSFNAANISGTCKCSVGGDDTSIWTGLRNYITLEAGRTEVTFKTNAATTVARIYFSCHSGSDSFRLWNVKLEKGNKATDWTPAPEDVDAGITNAQTTADTAKSNAAAAKTAANNAQSTADTAKANAATAQSTANTAKANAATAQGAADKAQTTADKALKSTKENAAQMAQMVTDFNGDIKNLQDQIDGNITTWFYDNDPAINLPPVTDWDTDKKKDAHLGDIYYNTVKGYAWRFMKSESTYSWERITDTDVTKALADAAKAQDTADSKRRIFYSTPTVPYDAGDLWVQGSDGDILRCAQAKTSAGSYNRNDWVLASKYTDDSALTTWITGDFATTIQGLEEGLVDAKIETYYQTTDPSTKWPTDKKMEHKGDLWYNSTISVQKYYRWSGTTWQELTATPPKEVFDSIDNKATIYTGATLPSSPSKGDLWFKGANNPILTYVGNTWVEYNKYTDNTRAEEAYDKAGEAAKTASNYIASNEYGLMVSMNTGEVKETPATATSRNILITGDNFQIRDGQKVLASYGEDTTIGNLNGGNITVSKNGIELSDGTYKAASIKAISEEEEVKTSVFVFNGQDAENISLSGRRWGATYYLDDVPSKIQSVIASGPYSQVEVFFPNSPAGPYGYMHKGNSIRVSVDGNYDGTGIWNWSAYDTLTVVYTKAARTTGVITGEEVYANNVFVRNPKETYVSLLDFIYPVGSIYMSVNSADPGTLIGGTWERIKDRFLLSAGDTYAAGATGGSADSVVVSHTHEQKAHSHGFSNGDKVWTTASGSTEPGNQISGTEKYYAATSKKDYAWITRTDSATPGINSTGESGAGKNMPPYLAVYVWKRIS